MLPLGLRLRNFLCYREPPPLDLRGMGVVCLTGNNGHGKTALLDAMAWALWGACSRSEGGRNPDALVHHGRTEMEVEVEFALEGRLFRVRRLYQRAGPRRNAVSALALQVADAPGRWRDISGNSIRETQGKITALLGMDYNTFVHTTCLQQGDADRFMSAEPQERRRLLASILGLDIYERALQSVKERLQNLEGRAELLRSEREHLQQDIARRPALEADLVQVQRALQEIAPRLHTLQEEVNTLRAQENALRLLQGERERHLAQAAAWEKEAQALSEQARQVEHQIQQARALLERKDEILRSVARYQEVSQRLEGMEEARREHDRLTALLQEAEKAIASEQARLEAALDHTRQRLQEAQRQADAVPALETALADLDRQESALRALEEQAMALQAQVERLREEASAYEAQAQRAREEMDALRQRLALLQAQPDPVCPLCKTPLGPEGKAHLEQEITVQGKALRQAHDTALRQAQQARQQAQTLAGQREDLRQRLDKERRTLEAQRARTARDLETARQAARQVQAWSAEAQALQERLAQGAFALEHRQRLAQARQALAGVGYDPQAHQTLRQQVRDLLPFLQEAERLAQAERALPGWLAILEDLRRTARQRQQDARSARERALEAEQALQDLPRLQETLQAREKELDALRQEQERLNQKIGAVRQALGDLAREEKRLADLQRESADLRADMEAYTVLRKAFAPQGIPTRIIESVVHHLSEEATHILQRLTHGQMALRLETTRPTKRGEPEEALEVRIDDGHGERDYRLFSGGERFRIDFALRLALGRLLAQRSGRPVRTLFIDEGFGTQDADGRLRLVEAVQAVRNDFDLIMVITHMEDLKEHFPTRIEVTRTPNGSWYEVVTG